MSHTHDDAYSTTNFWPAQADADIHVDGFTVRADGTITKDGLNYGHVNASAYGDKWLVSVRGVTTIWAQPEFTNRNDAVREAIRMCTEAA